MRYFFLKQLLFCFLVTLFINVVLGTKVFASDLCSEDGYTVLSINGISTDKDGAKSNAFALKRKLSENDTFNKQPLVVDFLHNKTHGKIIDILDVVNQKNFERNAFNLQDYDFSQLLKDASLKVNTQKVLLVAHSQGNFYANTFYDAVADEPGGIPSISIGVYGVASPSDHVAGDGLYLTSSTDKLIAGIVDGTPGSNILPPNTHINFKESDGDPLGHNFSKIYLNYEGSRIASDVKISLGKLLNNDEQLPQYPCISPPELTLSQKVQGAVLVAIDGSAAVVKAGVMGAYNASVYLANAVRDISLAIGDNLNNTFWAMNDMLGGLSANVVAGLPDAGNYNLTTLPAETAETDTKEEKNKETQNISTPEITQGDSVLAEPESTPVLNGETSTNSSLPPIVFASYGGGGGGSSGGGGGGGGGSPTPDMTAPVISVTGSNPIDVVKDSVYTDAGATALDDVDGVISVTQSGTVDTSIVGPYTITYSATDSAGNVATGTRVVNVVAPPPVPDTTPPVITLLGGATVSVMVGETYSDAGATASDDIDGDISTRVVTVNSVNTSIIGDYTVTYNVKDSALNSATEVTRLVQVVRSNVLYSQPDYSTEISVGAGAIGSFDSFTGKSGHIQSIKFAYNDHGNGAGHFIGVSVVDRTEGVNYYGVEEGGTCGDAYESTGLNAPTIVELDSAVKYKAYPCTGPELTLDPTHVYGVALFRNHGGLDTQRFYGSSDSNDSVYLHITDDTFPSVGKSIKGFKFPDLGSIGVIDEVNHSINITVPFGTDVSALAPSIKLSGGASVSPGNNVVQNFTNPVNYVVTAENGVAQSYVVTVLVHSNVIYFQPDNSVEITVADNVFLQNIITGASGNISNLKFSYNDHGNGAEHFMGVQVIDQSAGLSYYAFNSRIGVCGSAYESLGINAPTIVELDGTYQYRQYPCTGPNLILIPTHTYSVSLFRNSGGSNIQRFYGSSNSGSAAYFYIESNGIATLSSAKQITAFRFDGLSPSVVGTIDETAHTVSLSVPFGTNVTALVPSITISSYASISPNNNVAQDFTNPVTYTVTAEDGSAQSYIVTVTITPDSSPTLVSAVVASATVVDLTFSEDLDGRTITNADFAITRHTLSDSVDASETSPGVVRLTISDTFTAGEIPEIIYNTTVSNGVKDLDGNTVPARTLIATTTI